MVHLLRPPGTPTQGYEASGNRTSLQVSSSATGTVQQSYTYAFDANNRLERATDSNNQPSSPTTPTAGGT